MNSLKSTSVGETTLEKKTVHRPKTEISEEPKTANYDRSFRYNRSKYCQEY